jgi:hypothetical protein
MASRVATRTSPAILVRVQVLAPTGRALESISGSNNEAHKCSV